MASSHSASSSQEPGHPIAAQTVASKSASRRLPLPCWSNDEIVALIDVYRDKWYSLRRGNLRAPDWQEVADGVADRCPLSDPPKTPIQCRHKMEKLRKRYRAEIQRIGKVTKGNRYQSSWVHFRLMDSMELGTSSFDPSVDLTNQDDDEADENEEDLLLYPKGIKQAIALPPNRRYQGSIATAVGAANRNGNGVRFKIPNMPMYHNNRSFDDLPPPMNPQYRSGKDRIHGGGGMKRKNDSNALDEMVAAIQKLGDGFVKMERMKMDMARELESMRMKAEIKQTEMILETQQKLWHSFSKTVFGNKKKIKRMPTPES